MSFDGNNDWITVNDANALDLTTGMTLMAWVKPAATNQDGRTVLIKERPNGLAYGLYAADGANRPPAGYINRSGRNRAVVGNSALPINVWTHLAATYDGSVMRLFVNGTQVASRNQTGAITTSSGALRIGGNSVWGDYFAGLIDEVRIYNRASAPGQIVTDMNTALEGVLCGSQAIQQAAIQAKTLSSQPNYHRGWEKRSTVGNWPTSPRSRFSLCKVCRLKSAIYPMTNLLSTPMEELPLIVTQRLPAGLSIRPLGTTASSDRTLPRPAARSICLPCCRTRWDMHWDLITMKAG